ncbi:MAG: helix-turn-helix transcriptional regulator [Candidatus Saccharimonadales bacterium]
MQESKSNTPFKPLGSHLRYLREQTQESVAEVSGAVEIDMDKLERFEQGLERPSEDILMLLINHFDIQDNEAVQLWEMAGYEDAKSERFGLNADVLGGKPMMILMAMDMRTMYSDGIQVNASKNGVTMNFTHGKQPVSRVGMSREQAEVVLHALQSALLKSQYLGGPRLLPPSFEADTSK